VRGTEAVFSLERPRDGTVAVAGKKMQGCGGPQRTCIGCRKVRAKAELVRLVALDNGLRVDSDGVRSGRGVYLCMDPACLNAALKKKDAFSRALRARVGPPDVTEFLAAFKDTAR